MRENLWNSVIWRSQCLRRSWPLIERKKWREILFLSDINVFISALLRENKALRRETLPSVRWKLGEEERWLLWNAIYHWLRGLHAIPASLAFFSESYLTARSSKANGGYHVCSESWKPSTTLLFSRRLAILSPKAVKRRETLHVVWESNLEESWEKVW